MIYSSLVVYGEVGVLCTFCMVFIACQMDDSVSRNDAAMMFTSHAGIQLHLSLFVMTVLSFTTIT